MRRLDLLQPVADDEVNVGVQSNVSQSFIPQHANLSSIQLRVSNPDLQGNKSYLVAILDQNHKLLRSLVVTDANLGWEAPLRFDFAPIANSNKQLFFLTISQIPQIPEASTSAKSLGISTSTQDLYPDGSLLINNQKAPGDLTFQMFYQTSAGEFIKDSLIDFKKHASADPGFITVFVVVEILLLWLMLKRLTKIGAGKRT